MKKIFILNRYIRISKCLFNIVAKLVRDLGLNYTNQKQLLRSREI